MEETVDRIAKLIGPGRRQLATKLVLEGIKDRRGLLKVLDRLPIESRALVKYRPVKNIKWETALELERLVHQSFIGKLITVGSIRRGHPRRIKDLDFLLVGDGTQSLRDALRIRSNAPLSVLEIYTSGYRRVSAVIKNKEHNYTIDVFMATKSELPYALFHHTGSREYNIRTRAFAMRKGWKLNQYGLFYADTEKRVRGTSHIKTEKQLAEFMGLSWRLPSDREH